MPLNLTQVTGESLFSGRRFLIPYYQRHYAWLEKQCKDLLEDIKATKISGIERFMGYLTMMEARIGANRVPDLQTDTGAVLKAYDIIDGQQRLTTLTLLVSAISRILKDRGAERIANSLSESFLIARDFHGKVMPRLLIQDAVSARQLFFDLVDIGKPIPDPNTWDDRIPAMGRMLSAIHLFYKELEQKETDFIINFASTIRGSLIFGVTDLTDLRAAVDMFEGLNNRGKPLSPLDKVKAHCTGLVAILAGFLNDINAGETGDDYIRKFNGLLVDVYKELDVDKLSTDSLESEFLDACWPIIQSRLSKYPDISAVGGIISSLNYHRIITDATSIRLDRKKVQVLIEAAEDVLEVLSIATPLYMDLIRPLSLQRRVSYEKWNNKPEVERIRRLTQSLGELEGVDYYAPALIAFRLKFPDATKEYAMLLKIMEVNTFWIRVLQNRRQRPQIAQLIGIISGAENSSVHEELSLIIEGSTKRVLQIEEEEKEFKEIVTNWFSDGNVPATHLAKAKVIVDFWKHKDPELDLSFESAKKALGGQGTNGIIKRVRTRPGARGRVAVIQSGFERASTLHCLLNHVSNIIPATKKSSQDLAQKLYEQQGEARNPKDIEWNPEELKKAGVPPILVPDRGEFNVAWAEKLMDDFDTFVAETWPVSY